MSYDDLVRRLRKHSDAMMFYDAVEPTEMREAADAIERLQAQLAEAREALTYYACHGGEAAPCIRARYQCQLECGKIAGDAIVAIDAIRERTD